MLTQITPKLGPRPIGYLTNAAGKRTHAIIPLVEDDWDSLPEVEPDTDDLAFLARFNKNPDAFLAPAPITNPIRAARLNAKISQGDLAKALDISQAALSKQEREGHEPRPATLKKALEALGLWPSTRQD